MPLASVESTAFTWPMTHQPLLGLGTLELALRPLRRRPDFPLEPFLPFPSAPFLSSSI